MTLLATQVYVVVWDDVVETEYNSGGCWLIGKSFLYHCTFGKGNPWAVQYNTTDLPTLTVYGDCEGLMETIGGSVYQIHKDNN